MEESYSSSPSKFSSTGNDAHLESALKGTAKGVALLLVLGGSIRVIRLAADILVGRSLGPEHYGVFAFGVLAANTIPAMIQSTLSFLIPRFYQEADAKGDARGKSEASAFVARGALSTSFLFVPIVILAYPVLATALQTNEGRVAFAIMLFAVPFHLLYAMLATYFLGRKQVGVYALLESVLPQGLLSIGLIIGALAGLNLLAFATMFALSRLLVGLGALYLLFRLLLLTRNASVRWRLLLLYALPLILSYTGYWLIQRTDRWIIAYQMDEQSLGIYSAALVITAAVDLFLLTFATNFIPRLVKLYYSQEASLGTYFNSISCWLSAVLLPIFIIGVAFPETLIGLYGSSYRAGAIVLLLLLGSRALGGVLAISGQLLSSLNYQWLDTANTLIIGSASVIVMFLVVGKYGIVGVAVVWAVSNLLLQIVKQVETHLIFKASSASLRCLSAYCIAFLLAFLAILLKAQIGETVTLAVAVWVVSQSVLGLFTLFTEQRSIRKWLIDGMRRRLFPTVSP